MLYHRKAFHILTIPAIFIFFFRQLRETVDWIFSEPMVIYYIRNFKESMWPHGVLAEPLPTRTDEEKLRTRLKAKEKFLLIQPGIILILIQPGSILI